MQGAVDSVYQVGMRFMTVVKRMGHIRPENELVYEGLTEQESHALIIIHFNQVRGLAVRPGFVAEKLHITKSAFSQTLKSLELHGMVVRNRMSGDSRGVQIELTEKGRTAMDAIHEQRKQFFNQMVEYIGIEDFEQMTRTMERIIEYSVQNGMTETIRRCEEVK